MLMLSWQEDELNCEREVARLAILQKFPHATFSLYSDYVFQPDAPPHPVS